MKIDFTKVRDFFLMPDTSTPQEVDAKLDAELASRKEKEEVPEAQDKGEQTVASEVAATEKEVATANATDAAITAAVQLATADLQATVTSMASTVEAQAATITALQNRVEEVAGEDAAEPVTGKREASDIGKPVRAYRLNPMNQ